MATARRGRASEQLMTRSCPTCGGMGVVDLEDATVSERIGAALRVRKLKISDLSRRLDGSLSYQTVWNYVSGKYVPTLPFLIDAAKALDVSPSWLAFGKGDPDE